MEAHLLTEICISLQLLQSILDCFILVRNFDMHNQRIPFVWWKKAAWAMFRWCPACPLQTCEFLKLCFWKQCWRQYGFLGFSPATCFTLRFIWTDLALLQNLTDGQVLNSSHSAPSVGLFLLGLEQILLLQMTKTLFGFLINCVINFLC